MKYFVIAGEASGDLHGADLIKSLHQIDTQAEISGMGGDLMEKAGMDLLVHYSSYSFMGFLEVVQNLRKISKLLKHIKAEIVRLTPDRVVLIDYGGFNLKVAKFCKENGFETHFFILPKVWAWNEKRVHKISAYVDAGYAIFPFEQGYFRERRVNALYVGNPVVNQVDAYLASTDRPTKVSNQIALLPGSRQQEIDKILPTMLDYAEKNSEHQFVIAAQNRALFTNFEFPNNVRISDQSTYRVVLESEAAIVTSGTATLETALLGTPQVVCYKANALSYAIGKRVVKIKYISPVNLILDKLVIKELIQNELNAVNLATEVKNLLNKETSQKMLEEYKELRSVLGDQKTSEVTAQNIYNGI